MLHSQRWLFELVWFLPPGSQGKLPSVIASLGTSMAFSVGHEVKSDFLSDLPPCPRGIFSQIQYSFPYQLPCICICRTSSGFDPFMEAPPTSLMIRPRKAELSSSFAKDVVIPLTHKAACRRDHKDPHHCLLEIGSVHE